MFFYPIKRYIISMRFIIAFNTKYEREIAMKTYTTCICQIAPFWKCFDISIRISALNDKAKSIKNKSISKIPSKNKSINSSPLLIG